MKLLTTTLLLLILFFSASQAQPTITAGGPLEFCVGESVTLCVEPAYASYLWCSGTTTQCITVTESGNYCVMLLDAQGQLDSTFADSGVTVIVHRPEPLVVQNGDTLIVTNHFESYQWIYRPTGMPIPNETDSFFVAPLSSMLPFLLYS